MARLMLTIQKLTAMNNLVVRTLAGIVFLAVMIFGLIWDRAIFMLLFAYIMTISLREFYTITLGQRYRTQQGLGLLAALLAYLAVAAHTFFAFDIHWIGLALLALLLIPVSVIFVRNHADFVDISYIYAGLLYIALPITLSPLIMMDGEVFDGWMMLSFFIIIWVGDTGAYCFGTMFGQKENSRKLAPAISPKKSWIGFWSGVAFSAAAAVGLHYLTWLPFPLLHCFALGLIIGVTGVCGDLFESMWKRHFHVKDSGNAIPGHGGMLDRFDSSLVAIPFAVVYLVLFQLI